MYIRPEIPPKEEKGNEVVLREASVLNGAINVGFSGGYVETVTDPARVREIMAKGQPATAPASTPSTSPSPR